MLKEFFKLLNNLSLELFDDIFSLKLNFLGNQLFEFSNNSCLDLIDLLVFHVLNTDLCLSDKICEFFLDNFFQNFG